MEIINMLYKKYFTSYYFGKKSPQHVILSEVERSQTLLVYISERNPNKLLMYLRYIYFC